MAVIVTLSGTESCFMGELINFITWYFRW